MLSGAPGGGAVHFAPPSLAASSGLTFAGENYALLTGKASEEDAKSALSFFGGRDADFIAPVMPETPESVVRFFSENEILHRQTYTSMYLPFNKMPDRKAADAAVRVPDSDGARWGNAVWRAFGGEPSPAAADYESFGAYLVRSPANSAFALERGGGYIATALLHESTGAVGLYYFATLPEERRQGRATMLMNGIIQALTGKNKPLVLLATEEGLPFYLAYGFAAISEIPILARTQDI